MGKTIALLFLILAVLAGGIVWFDYLGLIDAKTHLAPVFNLIGKQGRSQPKTEEGETVNLDAERLAVRLESLDLREREMEKERADIEKQRVQNEQVAAELETRQKGLEEKERSMTSSTDLAETKSKNVEQFARYLNGMNPERAVPIIIAMDDQEAIDILRKTEEIAQAEGAASIVSYWLSLMPAERAAELQRKMAERP